MLWVEGSQAEINHLDVMLQAPVDGPDHNRQAGSQLTVENLDRNQIRFRIQMMDHCRNGSPVTEGIVIAPDRAIRCDGDAVDDLSHMRMGAAYSSVQNANAHRPAHAVTPVDSNTHPFSMTTTMS